MKKIGEGKFLANPKATAEGTELRVVVDIPIQEDDELRFPEGEHEGATVEVWR